MKTFNSIKSKENPSESMFLCEGLHGKMRQAKRFCKACKKFLCNDCLVELDIDHLKTDQIIFIEEYYNSYKAKMNTMITNITLYKDATIPVQASIKKILHEHIEKNLAKVDNFTHQVMSLLEKFTNNVKIDMKRVLAESDRELNEKSPIFKYLEVDYDKGKIC
jgi:hypothetical protein